MDVKVVGTTLTNKQFVNERSFLNSQSGGVLQDNYVYSKFTYIVQTEVPLDEWRTQVKTLLHPTGTLMFGEYNTDQPVNYDMVKSTETQVIGSNFTGFTFDASMEHYSEIDNLITADNTKFRANAFEHLQPTMFTLGGFALSTDNYSEVDQSATKLQWGNSWWDYEPIGLVKRTVDSDGEVSRLTTQDSDGTGNITNSEVIYYTTNSNRKKYSTSTFISQVKFIDLVNQRYTAFGDDSDLQYIDFTDETGRFQGIDYRPMLARAAAINNDSDSENDFVYNFKTTITQRNKEMRQQYEADLILALRDLEEFKFTDNGVEFTDYEAFDRKWNRINSKRTINTDGFVLQGYPAAVQNSSFYTIRNENEIIVQNVDRKDPLTDYILNDESQPDYWSWTNNYDTDQVNSFEIESSYTDSVSERDPVIAMKGRKK